MLGLCGTAQGHQMTPYELFIAGKRKTAQLDGSVIEWDDLHPSLFGHQKHVIRWASHRGRAAVFLDTGLGKARIALEWAKHSGARSLILVPLSIARQTIREAAAIDIEAQYVRSQDQVTGPGVWITNYEMEQHFDPSQWDALVADESSILKNHTGSTRTTLIERWGRVPRRLACTATPAPNDVTELTNHAEFLGAMSRVEMLASFFVHDEEGWRPKGHAVEPMYEWMSGWAIAARKPSDLGPFDDSLYVLPPLRIHGEIVHSTEQPEGQLFSTGIGGVTGRSRVRRATMSARLERAGDLLDHERPAIAWCGLNPEAERLAAEVKGAENLHGSLSPDAKTELIEAFIDGEIRVLVTKCSIAGMGLNLQHAAQQVFVGLGDSYEQYYQAIRRSWRFGQHEPVDVHIVLSDIEQEIVANVRSKEKEAAAMTDRLVRAMTQAQEKK